MAMPGRPGARPEPAGGTAGRPPTLAVMAGGVDRFYPSGNEDLLRTIAERGLILAEVPPGTNPTRYRFLQRNRLIAALCEVTVVVEARWRSGALNTAHHAEAAQPAGGGRARLGVLGQFRRLPQTAEGRRGGVRHRRRRHRRTGRGMGEHLATNRRPRPPCMTGWAPRTCCSWMHCRCAPPPRGKAVRGCRAERGQLSWPGWGGWRPWAWPKAGRRLETQAPGSIRRAPTAPLSRGHEYGNWSTADNDRPLRRGRMTSMSEHLGSTTVPQRRRRQVARNVLLAVLGRGPCGAAMVGCGVCGQPGAQL